MLWLGFVLIVFLVSILLAMPLKKAAFLQDTNRDELNKQVFLDRVQELTNELEQQRITQEEFNSLELELQKSLLDDASRERTAKLAGKWQPRLYWLSITLIPLYTLVIYWLVADWDKYLHWQGLMAQNEAYQSLPKEKRDTQWLEDLSNEELILLLRSRLYNNPKDTRGWMILASTLARMGAVQPAIDAARKAILASPEDISTRLNSAQLLITTRQGAALDFAQSQVSWVLSQHPEHEGASAIAGYLSFSKEDYATAIKLWQSLIDRRKNRGEAEGQGVTMLKKQIEQAKSLLAQKEHMTKASFSLTAQISLAPELITRIPQNTRVFVIVKGDDGMPAPVAVKPLTVADLPAQIKLSDLDAMMPGRLMSKMKQLSLTARVSYSGAAQPKAGDIQSSVVTVDTGTADTEKVIQLIINEPLQ